MDFPGERHVVDERGRKDWGFIREETEKKENCKDDRLRQCFGGKNRAGREGAWEAKKARGPETRALSQSKGFALPYLGHWTELRTTARRAVMEARLRQASYWGERTRVT